MAVKSHFADGLYIALLERRSADQIKGINNCVVWIILEKYIIDITNKNFVSLLIHRCHTTLQ